MTDDRFYCDYCSKEVSWKMAQTTGNRYRKTLCWDCQLKEIDKTYPPKLAEEAKKRVREIREAYEKNTAVDDRRGKSV